MRILSKGTSQSPSKFLAFAGLLFAYALVATSAQGQTLQSISVTPANPSIAAGTGQQFTATGTYSDNSTQNLTTSVTWTSTSTSVATITTAGLAAGLAPGSTTIEATSGTITGSTTLTVTGSGLVGYWTFNDGTGTTAADSSGNGLTATLVNGVSWVTGKLGDAVSANGVNQYGTVPAINLAGTSTVTVAMWVNRTYSTAGGHTLFEFSSNYNSSTTGFGLFPDDSSCKGISAAVHGNVGYSVACYTQPSSGAWHHLAIIYDKTQAGSNAVNLYIDGVLQTAISRPNTSTNTNAFGSNPLYLFARGGTQEYAAGEMDDLRLYNRALSATEVEEIYLAGNAQLLSLSVTPASPSIAKGSTQQFTATGTYSDGTKQNLTTSVTWSSTSTSVATITSGGLATGVGTGSATIQATSGAISGSTGLTVTPPTLVSIAVTPANPSIASGTTQQFTATGTYSDTSTQNLTGSVTWSSSNTAAATISSTGLATGVATGTSTIEATLGSISGSTSLTVTSVLVSITVTPANASLAKGATQQYTATGLFSDNGTLNLTSSVTWTSTNPGAATIASGGLATGVAAGSTTIQAALGGTSGSTGLTVTPPALVSIAVTPANSSLTIGATQQYTATGTYSDTSTQNLTSSATWTSTNTAVATITSGGLATGVAAGSTTIQATSGSITGSTGLTVTPSNLVGWWTFNDGSGTTAADSSGNGLTASLVNGVSWVTGKLGDAISANGVNQYGTVPAINLSGTKSVTVAMWLNRTYSTTGNVLLEFSTNYNSVNTGFGFFPDDSSCGGIQAAVHGAIGYSVGCYKQPTSGVWHHIAIVYDKTQAGSNAVNLYLDGVLQTATSRPYTSTNTESFGSNPLYFFSRGGSQLFTAGEMDDLRVYNVALTATQIQQIYQAGSPSLVSIAVTPANGSIAKGTTQQFTATGTYSDNSTQNLTGSVTWSSTNTTVATITSGGLATGVGTGSTTIQATSGSISGSTGATVTPPALVSIAVTPANPSIASGTTQQFTATGTYSDTSTQNLTSSVTWSSSNTAAATISSTGLATGVATGTSTIEATLGSISGSTSLTVTSVLVSITVTPANASLAKGATQQYTATGLFSDNGTLNLTSSVTWTSTNPAAATIASGGLATGVAAGSTTIQAALGGTSGSTGLTVTPPALVSIAVTPANSSLTIGATQQYTATGTYSDNSTQNLTSSATWVSTSTSVATITSGGLATGVAAGSTTIQAKSGAITGSTGLTVTPSNLVGWWTFNDGSGTTAADSSGNGLTASLVNGVSWVTGKIGDAISANGVNQYGTVPAINLSGTKSVTVAMWLNRTYSTTGNVLLEFSTNYNSVTTGFGFFPDDASCGGIQAAVHGAAGYSVGCYKQPTSGVWHHIAIVYDKTQAGSNAVNLYIDGVLQTATSRPYTSTNTENFGSNPLYFFSRGGSQLFTTGEMDDLRVYNVALTATQIQQIYQAGSPSLVSIAVTPANGSIAKGTTQQFTATGTYSDNSTQNLTGSVTWSSTNTTVATITSGGLATGVTTGSTTIQATSGAISGSTGLTVTPPTLVSIAVAPANSSIVKNTTQQFTATGTYSDTSTQNLTGSVTWSSTNTAVATIASGGLATGVATGSTTIEATSGSISGSTGLTVTATLVSIAVTPANASIAKGITQQFTATGTYSDNSTANLTSSVTWSSTNTGVATITSGGLATGVGTGSATIQATSGSISGSTGLTVTAPVLVSVVVTPANSSITTGATSQFTAMGIYSDDSSQNLTSLVTWTSTNTGVATISSTGLVTAVTTGSTTIQATAGASSGSTGLTVVSPFPGIPYDMWVDFEQCTSGSAPTTTCLASSTHGTAGTWNVGSMAGLITIQTAAQAPKPSGDTGTLGMAYNLANGADGYIQWNLPSQQSTLSFGLWYKTGLPGAYVEGPHFITLFNNAYGDMIRLSDERSSSNNARQIRVSPLDVAIGVNDNTWYWCTMKWVQGGAGSFSVYDASLNLVGNLTFTDDTGVPAQAILLGNTSGTAGQTGETTYFDDLIVDYTHANFPLIPMAPAAVSVSLNPTSVTNGSSSTGTVTLSAAAPAGGATVTLTSSNTAAATVPANVTVAGGATTANFTVNTSTVTFTTTVSISATYSNQTQSANLTVVPSVMAQVASDSFNRVNATTLGPNWTPLVGSTNVPLQIVSDQIESTATSPSIAKEMYYGGLNWTSDQYSAVQIVAATGNGYEGPAVRMTSNDTYYACVVYSVGAGNASVGILRDNAGTFTVLASSTTATIAAGNTVGCTVQGASLTMTNRTTSATLLTASDSTIPSGYPGVVDSAGSGAVTNYVMANWAAGSSAAPLALGQLASDNFNRANALNLGPNWQVGYNHGPIQIVSDQVQPYPAGGAQPSKEHYVAYGSFPNDQWSQTQVVIEDTLGDNAVELRASGTVDTLYVCDVNLTGAAGTAETRIAEVLSGNIIALVVDQQWSAVSPGDYIRAQVQGNLITLIDVTTGQLLLSTFNSDITSGYPGISLQAITGNPSDHIAANWSGGTFH